MTRKGFRALTLSIAALTLHTHADEILFNNGDKLTGKIVSIEGGKLTLASKVAGEIKIDMKEVKTFNTDAPIDLRLLDGSKLNQKVEQSAPGTIKVESAPAPKTVNIAAVKLANPNEAWTGTVVAGAIFARGNTDSDNAALSFDLSKSWEHDRLLFTGGYNFGRQRDDTGVKATTTDNWFATAQWNHFYSDKLYAYTNIRYDHDRIANVDYRLTPGIGAGYQWIDRPDLKFNTEAGLSYIVEQFNDNTSNDRLAARLAYHVNKSLNSTIKLFHNLEYFPSLERIDDYLVVTDAGIRADLTKSLFAEYKIEFRYNAQPAENASRTDLRHIVGIGFKF